MRCSIETNRLLRGTCSFSFPFLHIRKNRSINLRLRFLGPGLHRLQSQLDLANAAEILVELVGIAWTHLAAESFGLITHGVKETAAFSQPGNFSLNFLKCAIQEELGEDF